jgi:hypothetical protein
MSAAQPLGESVEERFAEVYSRTFDDFVKHIKGQGLPASDRVMEAAHERASDQAVQMAKTRGYRSMNFAPLLKSCLARSLARWGY